jgi:DNA-binding MarR family transcriptional regulator
MRLTYRTALVLRSIAELPGSSNRRIAEAAGVSDPGQISRLLARLERNGLALNSGGESRRGEAKAWSLTKRGEGVLQVVGES